MGNTSTQYSRSNWDPFGDPSIFKREFAIQDFVNAALADTDFEQLWNFPKTLRWVAEWYVDHQNTLPSWGKVAYASKELGESFRFNAGGGGSGINRANSVRSLETAIYNQSRTLGVELTPEVVSYLANVAFDLDYSADQLTADIMGVVEWDKLKAGSLTASYESIKSLASNYLVSVSDQTLQDYAKKINSNQATQEGIESFLKAQAKAANPWLAEYIDQGISPIELLRSAQDQIARSLQLDPAAVDFTDSRFMDMVTVDDNGTTRLANAREIARNIRSDKDWAKTDEAAGQLSTVGRIVGRIFGKDFF